MSETRRANAAGPASVDRSPELRASARFALRLTTARGGSPARGVSARLPTVLSPARPPVAPEDERRVAAEHPPEGLSRTTGQHVRRSTSGALVHWVDHHRRRGGRGTPRSGRVSGSRPPHGLPRRLRASHTANACEPPRARRRLPARRPLPPACAFAVVSLQPPAHLQFVAGGRWVQVAGDFRIDAAQSVGERACGRARLSSRSISNSVAR